MPRLLLIFIIFLVYTEVQGQINFNRKICFRNINGVLYFDTVSGTVSSQIYLASFIKINLNNSANKRQTKLLLENSENSTTGTFRNNNSEPYHYLLTTTFVPTSHSYKVLKRKIESFKPLYLKKNENIFVHPVLDDSTQFHELRKDSDPALLEFLSEDELMVKTIYKDLDGDKINEIVLVSTTPLIGYHNRPTADAGPEYKIQILKKTAVQYQTVFTYNKLPQNLGYVNLIKPKGQIKHYLILSGGSCGRDCIEELVIMTVGNSNLDNCAQELNF